MTLVSHIPFSELASSELAFNFLPSSTIENLESENENIRLSTIRDLIATVRTTPPSHINVEQFTNYMLKFLDDEFIQISQLTCSVIESLCINLSGNMTIYKNFFMKIAIRFLGSEKIFGSKMSFNILHIMLKEISPQNVLSDLFTRTLTSPSYVLTNLFNFITNELVNDTIQPIYLTRYSFSFEDALNSDDIQLEKAVKYCLFTIKGKDPSIFGTIFQKMNMTRHHQHEMPNITYEKRRLSSSQDELRKLASNTRPQTFQFDNPYQSNIPIISTNGKASSRFYQASPLNRASNSPSMYSNNEFKPYTSSTNGYSTPKVKILNIDTYSNNSGISQVKSNPGIRLISNTPPDSLINNSNNLKKERLLKIRSYTPSEVINSPVGDPFFYLLEDIRSDDLNRQYEAIDSFSQNMNAYIPQIRAHLRHVCTFLLEQCSTNEKALLCLEQLFNLNGINISPLADIIANSLIKLISSPSELISNLAAICFTTLIESIDPQKAIDVLVNGMKAENELQRAQIAKSFGQLAGSIILYTQPLMALAELLNDESEMVRENAKFSIELIAGKCDDFISIVTNFVSDPQKQQILFSVFA